MLAILAEGLPALPGHIIQLNGLLASSPVDLKRISEVIQSDPGLTGQVIHLCNSALFGIRRRIFKVEEAAILMGADRLRTLVFTCYLMDCSSKWLQERGIQEHWRHSFMVALLSERVARAIKHPMPDQAYLSGLLHDVGKLPLLMVAAEEGSVASMEILLEPGDNLEAEREYFGLDHCEVGRWVGSSWEFYPCHIEVFRYHHHPAEAKHDPLLVGIVAVADHFCEQKELQSAEAAQDLSPSEDDAMDHHICDCLPMLSSFECDHLRVLLESEYRKVLPMIEESYSALVSKKPDSARA
ncbi:MAG TPA: HDOD domain-containing protein [Candidatus Acidoferrales bacterium]|nr:HDOD domain-containing protein [Candidatus Acidoferrales bacterium]